MKGWLDKYGKEINANEGHSFAPENWMGEGYSTQGRNYSPAWGGQFAMGGSIPGSVGFTYARTKGIPSNGPYAKKTKASAQKGKKIKDRKEVPINIEESKYKEPYNEAMDFTKNWMNSPMYKKMLMESVKGNKELYNKIDEGRRAAITPENISYYEESIEPHTGAETLTHAVGKDKGKSSMYFNTDTIYPDWENNITHELSHITDQSGNFIPGADAQLMRKYAARRVKDSDKYERAKEKGALHDLYGFMKYVNKPTETRARINNLRKLMLDQGVYDPFTQPFSKDMFNKYKQLEINEKEKSAGSTTGMDPYQQLRLSYTDEEIEDMLNKISKLDGVDNLTTAENGMTFYQHGLDWKPKSISRDGSDIPKNQNAKFSLPRFDMPRAATESTAIVRDTPKGKKSTATTGQKSKDIKASTSDMGKAKRMEEKEKQQRIAERKAAKAFNEGKSKTFTFPTGETKSLDQMDWREKAYVAGKSVEGKGRFNENDEAWYDDWVNPLNWIGEAAGGIGTAPYEARESNSNLPYVGAIANPLIQGMLGFDPLGGAIKLPGKVAKSMESGLLSKLKSKPTSLSSSSTKPVINTARNLEDLQSAKNFAQQYGYELPENLERISQSDELTNRTIRGMMDRHNTFVRGVSTNWEELGKRNPEILKYLESKGFDLSTKEGTKSAAEYMSTHVPIQTGYGRSRLTGDIFRQKLDAIYTSNSIPTAEGYTYGKGYITKVKKPTDFSSIDRKDWITKNNPEYYDNVVPKSKVFSTKDLDNINKKDLDIFLKQGRIDTDQHKKILNYFDEVSKTKKELFKKYDITDNTDIFDEKFNPYFDELEIEKNKLAKNIFYEDYNNKLLKTDFNPKDRYAHYMHLGYPGDKILQPIKSWEITPEIWKHKSRAHDNVYTKKLSALEEGGVIKDDMGQWAHPGEITEIGSNQITMKGVPYPVLGISDTGDQQMMYPEQEYKFKGKKVTEYPMAQKGYAQPTTQDSLKLYNAQIALNNFYNNEVKAGRLKKVDEFTNPRIKPIDELKDENLKFYRGEIAGRGRYNNAGDFDNLYKQYFNLTPDQVKKLEYQGLGVTKAGNEYQAYYKDIITPMQNIASPFAMVDSRIQPQRAISYKTPVEGARYPGGAVTVYDYDPLAIKPSYLRSKTEQQDFEKKYGKTKDSSTTSTQTTKPKPGKWKPLTPEIAKGHVSGDISKMVYRETGDPNHPYDITGAPPKPKPEPSLKGDKSKAQTISTERKTPSGKIKERTSPNATLPPIQNLPYRVDYIGEDGKPTHTNFASNKEGEAFMKEIQNRPMGISGSLPGGSVEGYYENLPKKKKGGWLDKYN